MVRMAEILVTLKLRTKREPDQVKDFLLRSAAQAGDVSEARFRVTLETKETNADKVRAFLRTTEGATQAEISRELGINAAAVSKAVKKLRHEIKVKPGRRYYIPR